MNFEYTNVIYPDVQTEYPHKLVEYLYLRFIEPMKHFKVHKFLDVGCGKGVFLNLFNQLHEEVEVRGEKVNFSRKDKLIDVWGIDKRDDCKTMVGTKTFKELELFSQCDVENKRYPFLDNTMTVIFIKSVIEHIQNPDNMITEALRVLKPGGQIIILTPDWHSQMNHFWDDYTHVHPYTRKSLMNMLKIHGFTWVTCEEFYQLPYIWKWPWLKFVPELINVVFPDSWKWKDDTMTNGRDCKWIRFSKEKMLLATGRYLV